MNIPIKRCPCCGKEADTIKTVSGVNSGHEWVKSYRIQCDWCGLKTGEYTFQYMAASVWNTRNGANETEAEEQ